VKLMKYLKHQVLVLLILFIGSSSVELSSQGVKQKPTRQSSMEAFSRGDYEKAYSEFSELLKTYSKDPLYKYYTAVCLIKLERDPAEAETLILQAIESNTAARPLPAEALFYLGRAKHLSGFYSEAIDSYTKYSDQVGKKVARELGVPDFIQQCINEKGAIEKKPELTPEPEEEDVKPVVAVVTAAAPEVKSDVISNQDLYAREDLPEEYSLLFEEALALQFLADSASALVTDQKKKLEALPGDKKPAARAKISELELLALSSQKSADQKYREAQAAMNPDEQEENSLPDTLAQVALPITDTVDVFYYFNILEKPVTDPAVKIQIDPEIPQGLIYRIQVAVFRNPVAPVFFKGITPVYGFRSEGSDLKIYYAGMFRRMSDARNALAGIKGKGFRDSFITSFMGNKVVSPDRAALLEKEWGSKPFERVVDKKQVVVRPDTLIPTLTFRVEVMRVLKPLKPNVIESIKTLSGNRGLDIITLEDKKIAYLIGNFITFESAAEYADLMVRNGYRDARVVAWLGTKEIPVDTARQLFENLK
jgi:hypothetical protein